MNFTRYDLHLHTTASDGTWTPSELVAAAKKHKLKGIAVTDHDTVSGIREAQINGKKLGVTVIPGVELSTEQDGGEIHILGLFINPDNKDLGSFLETCRKGRIDRNAKIVRRLNENGYHIELDRVAEIAGEGSIGRPHIAEALIEKGYVANRQEAFDNFLGKDCIGYVPRFKVTPEEAVANVLRAKGLPVCAHPGLFCPEGLIEHLRSAGLEGIEVYHSAHTELDSAKYLDLAKVKGMLVTGGSDSHGSGVSVEAEIGCCTIGEAEFRALITRYSELYGTPPDVDIFA